MDEGRRYRFDPLDRSVFLGFTAAQCVWVAAGLLAAAVARTADLPLPALAAPLIMAAGVALVPVRGRPACEWLGDAAGSWVGDRRRGRQWLASLPLLPAADDVPLPPCLAGLDLVEVAGGDGSTPVGLVGDRSRRSVSAVIPVGGVALVLQVPADRDRLLGGWGRALAEFAGHDSVVGVSWSVTSGPGDLADHGRWVDQVTSGAAAHPAADAYRSLLADGDAAGAQHQTLVTVTVAEPTTGRPRDDGPDGLVTEAMTAVETLSRGLRSAGLTPGRPLSGADLRRVLAVRADPTRLRPPPPTGRLVQRLTSVPPSGPLAVRREWSRVRIDASVHRCYWVESWPGQPRPGEWLVDVLAPLDDTATVYRSVTVHLVPEAPAASTRRLQRELARHESDAETRDRRGRRTTAAHRRTHQAVLDREEELVSGEPVVRYCGLVTVSAEDPERLDRDCRAVEQLARNAGLGLRVVHGRQDLAWAAALPFGLAPGAMLAS